MPTVLLNPYRFYYRSQGCMDRPALLFLHGFMGSSADFGTIMNVLATDFYCVAVDLPGHGQTQVQPGVKGYSMAAIAAALLNFMAVLQLSPCQLVGYSMGGRLALYLACHFPQSISSLLLASASPGLATEAERLQRQEQDHQLALDLESGGWPDFLQRWYRQPLFETLQRHPDFDVLRLKRQNNNPLELAQALRGMGTGVQPSLWAFLPDLMIPTHLVVGALDAKFCSINRTMREQCPVAQLSIVPDCGHAVHLEAPQALSAILLDP